MSGLYDRHAFFKDWQDHHTTITHREYLKYRNGEIARSSLLARTACIIRCVSMHILLYYFDLFAMLAR